ncbi:MAG: APC family permease [Proteobacteria bacterium]|nr:APC family permease [Pseudomonadota bacterium]
MQLQRRIGLVGLTFIALSGMLGSGWLFAPHLVAQQAGPAALVSWIIGGAVMLLLALTFAEVTAMLPVAGGLARVPYFSHGPLAGVAMGWTAWVGYATTAPIEVLAMMRYIDSYLPFVHEPGSQSLTPAGQAFVIALLAVMVLINAWGVAFFARINTGITWLKLAVPLVVAGAILTVQFEGANLATPSFSPGGWVGILGGVSTGGVIFAFIGFRHAIDMAGETRNPQRAIPLALIGSVVLCLGIYGLAQLAYLGGVPADQLSRGWAEISFDHDYGPFAAIGIGLGMTWLIAVIFAGAVVAPFGGGLVSTASNARLALALGQGGLFPRAIAALSPRGVPLNGLLFNLAVGAVMVLVMSFEALVTLNGAAIVLSFLAGPVALVALRRQAPEQPRLFRLPMADALSAAAFVGATWTLYWSGWNTTWVLLTALAVGMALFLVMRLRAGGGERLEFRHIAWLPTFMGGLAVLSYLGNFGGGLGVIPFGWDIVAGAVLGLLSFVHAFRARLPADAVASELRGARAVLA